MLASERIREHSLLAAVADSSSAYYKGITRLLTQASVDERRAREASPRVVIPFSLTDREKVELEAQFRVVIKAGNGVARARMTARVSALVFIGDSMLLEHAGGPGRRVLQVDGDVASWAYLSLRSVLIERTHATPRLQVGYSLEEERVLRMSAAKSGTVRPAFELIRRQMLEGGGENYWPTVRADGPLVETVVINHFKTPMGPVQFACLCKRRGAVGRGVFPFQLDMRWAESGELQCFPGVFYVDKIRDVITLVPNDDATMAISHPYKALMAIIENNSFVVEGQEWLCEKYVSFPGVVCYEIKPMEEEPEESEVLRTHLFDATQLAISEITYPCVRVTPEGVPVGVSRAKVRLPTDRLNKAMLRAMTSANSIVHPAEVHAALMDYNNTVVNTLDSAGPALRISDATMRGAAMAIALKANWRRHQARGTFNVLLNAVKSRYVAGSESIPRLAFMALASWLSNVAWFSRPYSIAAGDANSPPGIEVLDACGNDFTVLIEGVDPWVEIAQVAGEGVERACDVPLYPWFPKPRERKRPGVLERARAFLESKRRKKEVEGDANVGEIHKSSALGWEKMTSVRDPLHIVGVKVIEKEKEQFVLGEKKKNLLKEMIAEQDAVVETAPCVEVEIMDSGKTKDLPRVPVVEVDPYSAILEDLNVVNGGMFERRAVATGYRIAEIDVNKVTEGSVEINDAKRNIPKPRRVKLPKVDLGVEGKRVSSQTALTAALFKRNVGVPANRGFVDLTEFPERVVKRVIAVCFRDNWKEILNKHLETGLWEPNVEDLESFIGPLDESKVDKMLGEFFQESSVDLTRWMLMAKGKIKPSRGDGVEEKIDHSQTIAFLSDSKVNAMYSSMTRRFKKVFDEMLRPNISVNSQDSDEEHEEWYNSMEEVRRSLKTTFSYLADIKCYDRSQEHVALKIDIALYKMMGLSKERLRIWEQTHGLKKATSMMYGVILMMILGGLSGIWKTLFRNGWINLCALVYAADLDANDIVMLDIKGDDSDSEFSRPVRVEKTVEGMSMNFNLSAKYFTADVRYMCKKFRIRKFGWWYHIDDPWARMQSACTPVWVGNHEDSLEERWISLSNSLRGYDNGLLVDAAAEAAQQLYALEKPLYGFARSLAVFRQSKHAYISFFGEELCID